MRFLVDTAAPTGPPSAQENKQRDSTLSLAEVVSFCPSSVFHRGCLHHPVPVSLSTGVPSAGGAWGVCSSSPGQGVRERRELPGFSRETGLGDRGTACFCSVFTSEWRGPVVAAADIGFLFRGRGVSPRHCYYGAPRVRMCPFIPRAFKKATTAS